MRDTPNFRLVLFADGLDGPLDVETPGENGGFFLAIHQSDGEYPLVAFEIEGHRDGETLVIEVRNRNGLVVASSRTPA